MSCTPIFSTLYGVHRILILRSIQFMFFYSTNRMYKRGENITICGIWNGGGKAGVSSARGFTPGPLRRVK